MAELSPRTEGEKARFREILTAISNLNHRELLAYWMDQEVKKAEMYHKLYQLSHDVNWDKLLSELFFQLYKDSLRHAEALLGVFKGMFPTESPPKVNLPALEVELSEERLRDMIYHSDLRDILEYLMETEKLAHDVYRYLAEKTEDENSKATLIWLSNIENDHYQKLRNLYVTLFGTEPGE
ncbi:rubrerythrin [Thermococcus celericrescens]|uniref:Rubrerythrin n=1 Tax=Thermococcus celericrescens TaxID=227598 RepID=A0A100XWU4_9EURY|nr:ferritin family protein [Thermococcus celericrescens]KUH32752.1 rubrerythrin [Thermococcus celericrescens]